MVVTYEMQLREGLLEIGAAPIDPTSGIGILEQYICATCGVVEWYCLDPEAIPINPGYMTEAIDYEPSGAPYR